MDILDFPTNYIPCHPIAGSEKSGLGQVQSNLFNGKKMIMITGNSCVQKCSVVKNLFSKLGMEIVNMNYVYELGSHN